MNSQLRYQVGDDIIYRRVDDEIILVNLKNDRIFSLNDTAAHLWEGLAAGDTLVEVKARLLEAYDVDDETLDREISQLLSQLMGEGFLHDAGAG